MALRRQAGPPLAGTPGTIWIRGHAAGRILKVCVPIDDQTFVITAVWSGEEG